MVFFKQEEAASRYHRSAFKGWLRASVKLCIGVAPAVSFGTTSKSALPGEEHTTEPKPAASQPVFVGEELQKSMIPGAGIPGVLLVNSEKNRPIRFRQVQADLSEKVKVAGVVVKSKGRGEPICLGAARLSDKLEVLGVLMHKRGNSDSLKLSDVRESLSDQLELNGLLIESKSGAPDPYCLKGTSQLTKKLEATRVLIRRRGSAEPICLKKSSERAEFQGVLISCKEGKEDSLSEATKKLSDRLEITGVLMRKRHGINDYTLAPLHQSYSLQCLLIEDRLPSEGGGNMK